MRTSTSRTSARAPPRSLGAGAARLRELNPKLVYCSDQRLRRRAVRTSSGPATTRWRRRCRGFPERGGRRGPAAIPRARRWRMRSPASTPPTACSARCSNAARSGRGKLVEVSMLEAMAHFAVEPFAAFFALGVTPKSADRPRLAQAYILRTADGRLIAIHLSSLEKFWLGLVKALDATSSRTTRASASAWRASATTRRSARSSTGDFAARHACVTGSRAPERERRAVRADQRHRRRRRGSAGRSSRPHRAGERRAAGRSQAVRPPCSSTAQRATSVAAAPLLDQHGAAIRAAVAEAGNGRRARQCGATPRDGVDSVRARRKLFPTTLVGSYAAAGVADRSSKLAGRFPPRVRARELWRIPEAYLAEAQDDATLLAIRAQEEAGLDIITDGEIRRESYSNRFATALEGVDLDNPGTRARSQRPSESGAARRRPIRRRHAVAGRRPEVPARAHHAPGEGHGARSVHDGAAGADRLLRRQPRSRRDGLRDGRERGDPRPVRRRRRRRADRRALHAGASRRGARVRAEGAQSGARRRDRDAPPCTSASATPRSSTRARRRYSFLPELASCSCRAGVDRDRAVEARLQRAACRSRTRRSC